LLPKNVLVLVINKSDRIKDKAVMMPFAQKVAALYPFAAIVPVSATLRFQLENLEGETRKYLPLNPPMFAEDDITDRSEKFLATEIVREKLFRFVGDELPYTSTVLIEKFEQEGNLRRIFVAILVDRDGHKSMVIGQRIASQRYFHAVSCGYGEAVRRPCLSRNLGQSQIRLGRYTRQV
jgi:GTP-binding protein Era